MIPPEIALAAWLVIGTFLMVIPDPAKAFSVTVLTGFLSLPWGAALHLPVLPSMGKMDVILFSVIAGTVLFHSQVLTRFRPKWYDALLPLILVFTVATSYVNGFGIYDGIVTAYNDFLGFVVSFYLYRVFLGTAQSFRTFLVVVVWASVVYAPFALWEWRMSPQIHTTIYGYFQHSFLQHYRFGMWRPVVCMSHGLQLGRFFAFAAFLAILPMRDVLRRRYSGGQWLFLGPLLGLVLSMSFSPVMMFAGFCGLYFGMRRFPVLGYVLPVGAAIWTVFVFLGYNPLYGVVDIFARINVARAESLQYRLDALNEYRVNILQRPIFGWGGWGNGRITGLATDSVFLIRALSRGLIGACLLYGYYFLVQHSLVQLVRNARGTPFINDALAAAAVFPLGLALCAVDQGLDLHVMILGIGAIGFQQFVERAGPHQVRDRLRKRAQRARVAAMRNRGMGSAPGRPRRRPV